MDIGTAVGWRRKEKKSLFILITGQYKSNTLPKQGSYILHLTQHNERCPGRLSSMF